MKVLIISSNTLPASPSGPAYIAGELRQSGELQPGTELFSGVVYVSPHLNRSYLEDLVISLRSRPGYQVQVNKSSVI